MGECEKCGFLECRCPDHVAQNYVPKSDLRKLVKAAKMAIEWIEDDRFDDDYISEDWYHEMKAALELIGGE